MVPDASIAKSLQRRLAWVLGPGSSNQTRSTLYSPCISTVKEGESCHETPEDDRDRPGLHANSGFTGHEVACQSRSRFASCSVSAQGLSQVARPGEESIVVQVHFNG